MRRKSCALLPATGRTTQLFILLFTESGNHTLAHPCEKVEAANCRAWINYSSHIARIGYQEQEQNPPNLEKTKILPSSVTPDICNPVILHIPFSCIPLADMMSQKQPVMAVAPLGVMLTPSNQKESKDGWMSNVMSIINSPLLLKSPVVSRRLRY